MPTRMPSNSGVLIDVTSTPSSNAPGEPEPPRPVTGTVLRVGGGVPWLTVGVIVAFDPTRATYFDGNLCSPAGCNVEALVHQRDILAVIDPDYGDAECSG